MFAETATTAGVLVGASDGVANARRPVACRARLTTWRRRGMKIDTGVHPLVNGEPPDWASGWGQDRVGVFVAFTYAGVTQRLALDSAGAVSDGLAGDEDGPMG